MKDYSRSNLIILRSETPIAPGSWLYKHKADGYNTVISHYALSKQLISDLSYLFNYEINGFCRVDWDSMKSEPYSQELAAYVRKQKESVEYYNPDLANEIKKKIEEIRKRNEIKKKIEEIRKRKEEDDDFDF